MSAKVINSHILLESCVDEGDRQFEDDVEKILVDIYGHRPDWLRFSPGRRFAWGDVAVREFVCMAGSVAARIIQRASRGELARAVVYQAEVDGVGRTYTICAGRETEVCPGEFRAVGMT
jgi:hypothetical protein